MANPSQQQIRSTRQPHRPKELLQDAMDLASQDMQAVDRIINRSLTSEIDLINTVASYIVHSGGKRLRPLILLLCANAHGYRGNHHILLAAAIEFIHTATLLHDDVVDASATRRGQPTANEVWGNEASVLVGDFLYSRSFELIVEIGDRDVMQVLARTTNAIAEGEMLQLMYAHSPQTTEQQYMDTIQRKTAKLIESAARLGGMIAGQDEPINTALASYGMHLGTAFQLVDDVLDYDASSHDIGKDIGDDLAEGTPTLPLIHVLDNGNPSEKCAVSQVIETGDRNRISEILRIVRGTGALDYTMQKAHGQAELAIRSLAPLPHTPYRRALEDLARFSVLRDY